LEHGALCPDCWGKFNWIGNPKCSRCGYPFPADLDLGPAPLCPVCASDSSELDWMRAACVYDDFSKNIMLPFKHAGALKYQKIMSRAMISALHELPSDIDLVMPVPLAYRRLFKRGYNQATLLARPIAKHLNARLDVDSVQRKYRPDMGHKNSRERFENIRGVFNCINPDKIRGKTILLVDDVMTTGATFSELYKILKRADARHVYGVVFCRVVRAI
jgi:ComF family protein